MSDAHDFVVVGGGIVGLAVAMRLTAAAPGASVLLLEKEADWAQHQSGRNSGVLHAGIYYRPGSAKARLATAGRTAMVEFARRHDVPVRIDGKLIVATTSDEIPALERLYDMAVGNGVPVNLLDAAGATEVEPNVAAVAAIHSPGTGTVDFAAAARAMAEVAADRGADLRRSSAVAAIEPDGDRYRVVTTAGTHVAKFLISCAGLHADRIAEIAGLEPPARIVPFRGEYYDVVGPSMSLVRSLIYPVPDARFPFLGVHLTRSVDGTLHAGPNAVLALAREGYRRRDVSARDLAASLTYPGTWRLAARHWKRGAAEVIRSMSRARFAGALQRLVPDLAEQDLVAAPSGVRAQAVRPDGSLVDDFLLVEGPGSLHVLNAPSPAATASLAIADHIVTRALQQIAQR